MSELIAVVPYRADAQGTRQRNLTVVLGWLADGDIRTVLAEHSDVPDATLVLPDSVERVHIPAAGKPFSKAQACNAGFYAAASIAHSPLIALVDADTLTALPTLLQCADSVRAGHDAVRPFGRLVELDEPTTAAVAAGAPLPDAPEGARSDDRAGEHIPLCGGIVVLRSEAYEAVGGMDTSFVGWGGEDDALSIALIRSGLTCGIRADGVAFHLAHPRPLASRYEHDRYTSNLARARWWHEASDEEIAAAMSAGKDLLHRAGAGAADDSS